MGYATLTLQGQRPSERPICLSVWRPTAGTMPGATVVINGRHDRVEWTVAVGNRPALRFRPATSTACTFEGAGRLGRQPEMEIESEALSHVAPKAVFIHHVGGAWRGGFWFQSGQDAINDGVGTAGGNNL